MTEKVREKGGGVVREIDARTYGEELRTVRVLQVFLGERIWRASREKEWRSEGV